MKFAAVLLASATLLPAQVFVSGQGARAVIGQTSFTRQVPGASETQLGSAGGIAVVNDTLYVVDSSRVFASPQNHRVLVFPNISQQLPGPKMSRPWTTGDVRCPLCGGIASTVLGQVDFAGTSIGLAQDKFRTPTAVASDGQVLAVTDTDNNRVLVWLALPTRNGQPADVVIGQPDFKTNGINFGGAGQTPSAKGLRSPQGVWIQDGKLYIADTQNNRILIFNSIPRANGASADLVLGAPNMTTFVQQDLVAASQTFKATPKNMLSPVAVTSDGRRLIVTDLGHNRVLIWNSIPTVTEQPADVEVGQPDITSTDDNLAYLANNSTKLCPSNGTDPNDATKLTYPALCAATLNFPRHALSDGKRLYIADGGNDRILIFNEMPTSNGKAADIILGQLTENLVQDSDPERISSADSFRTPSALAWDGTNLYVSDPFNRRVVVYTPGDLPLPITGVRNAASRDIFALTAITFLTAPKENDEITLKIAADKEYKYKALKDDTVEVIIRNLVTSINAGAGDPKVLATSNPLANQIVLTSRIGGAPGNDIEYAVTFSENAQLTVATASGKLAGGQDAAKIAPGTIVSILGDNLSEVTLSADATKELPQTLGDVEVYIDGIRAPLLMVSPGEIRSQMPWEVSDSSSVSVYVRRLDRSSQVLTTTAIGVPIIPQNPGIFAVEGLPDPRPAIAYHASSQAIGVVSVDGAVKEGDTATVTIEDRPYTYTVKKEDTLNSIRDALVDLINGDEKVMAEPSSLYTRILLKARVPGPEGEGIAYSAKAVDGANVIMTPLSPALCCSAREGSPITQQEPARPGELIYIITTGLGFVKDEGLGGQVTGGPYHGPADNTTSSPVDDAQVGGKTANVLSARLIPGLVGVYQVRVQLNSDIPTNPQTQMWIAQLGYISNIVALPVVNPVAPFPQ